MYKKLIIFLICIPVFGEETQSLPDWRAEGHFLPTGYIFQENILRSGLGLDGYLLWDLGLLKIGPQFRFTYTSLQGLEDNYTGAWILPELGILLEKDFTPTLSLSSELGGGWHRGAWTDPIQGTLARSEIALFSVFSLEWDFLPSFFSLSTEFKIDFFFGDSLLLQPQGQLTVWYLTSFLGDLGAGLDFGYMNHPGGPRAIENPWSMLAIRWQVKGSDLGTKAEDSSQELYGESQEPDLTQAKEGEELIFDRILFYPDETRILESSLPTLEAIRLALLQRQDVRIEIRGFVNSTGDDEGELILSQQRAQTIRQFLIQGGIDPMRLIARGMGSLVAKKGEDPMGNRRVVLVILPKEED